MSAPASGALPALVQVRRLLPAPPEAAFRCWTDPLMVEQWNRAKRALHAFGWRGLMRDLARRLVVARRRGTAPIG